MVLTTNAKQKEMPEQVVTVLYSKQEQLVGWKQLQIIANGIQYEIQEQDSMRCTVSSVRTNRIDRLTSYCLVVTKYMNDHQQELEALTREIRGDAGNYQLYFKRGKLYYNMGKEQNALEDFNHVLELKPTCAEGYFNRGQLHSDAGRKQQAMEDFNKVIELDPSFASAYINRGALFREMGEQNKALEDYNMTIKLNPNHPKAYFNRGNVLKEMGRTDKALKDFNKAIQLNPQYLAAYNNRGVILGEMGQKEMALADYNTAINLNRKDPKAYTNRGRHYEEKGDVEKAFEDFSKAIELEPSNPSAYNNRGNLLTEMGYHQKALEDFHKAIGLNSKFAAAYNNRAGLLKQTGQNKQALADYNRSIQLDPQNGKVYSNRGILFAEMGHHDRALQDYNFALQLKPNDSIALNNRANILRLLSQTKKSLEDINRAISLDPNNPIYYCSRARLYLASDKDRELARADLLKAKELVDNKVFGRNITIATKAIIDENAEIWLKSEEISKLSNVSAEDSEVVHQLAYELITKKLQAIQQKDTSGHKIIQMERFRGGQFVHYDHSNDNPSHSLPNHHQPRPPIIPEKPNPFLKMIEELEARFNAKVEQLRLKQRELQEENTKLKQRQQQFETKITSELASLQNDLSKFSGLFQKELLNHQQLNTMRQRNPNQYDYTVSLSRLLYNLCKAFQLLATGALKEVKLNESKKTKGVLSVISAVVGSLPIVGEYAQKLCDMVTAVVDKYDDAKFDEIKFKFDRLSDPFITDSELQSVIIQAVIVLSEHPKKQEEVRAISNGEQRPIQSKLKRLVKQVEQQWQRINKEITETLFRIVVPEERRMKVLATKDFALFLQVVFTTKPLELKSVQVIIKEELIDEYYVPKQARQGILPATEVSMRSLDEQSTSKRKYLSGQDGELKMEFNRSKQWKIINCNGNRYVIKQLSTSRYLAMEESRVVLQTKQCQWTITNEKCGQGLGWLIAPADRPSLSLCYTYEAGLMCFRKSQARVELVDRQMNGPSNGRHFWAFEGE